MITYRQIIESDIPDLFRIRIATWHNDFGAVELGNMGINHESVALRLNTDHAGWIAHSEGNPVGFAMANRNNGELWVIAVLPEYENNGIGRELMRQAEAWLFSHGWDEIWLTTDLDENYRAVGFYRHIGWEDWKIEEDRFMRKANTMGNIEQEEHSVSCSITQISRIVRLRKAISDRPHRLCLFLDGEHYWRDMNVLPILEELCRQGKLPRMSFAFVGHVSGAVRQEDYLCNEDYAKFLYQTVLPKIYLEIPSVDRNNHIISGMSLSGLMANYICLKYADQFTACLSQSGSYWWRPDWFAQYAQTQGSNAGRYWLSVGDEEIGKGISHPPAGLYQGISQLEGVEQTINLLKEIGATVRYHRYKGGHSMNCWKEEISDALVWLSSSEDFRINDQKLALHPF